MRTPTTTEEFLDLVAKSKLLSPTLIRRYTPDPGAEAETNLALANRLVRDRYLTPFQAKQLLRGRFKGFFLGGKFKVLEHLGSGGMGTVLLCEHLLLRKLVAVKVLTAGAESSAGTVERFFREARAVAALDHPNIVRVFDVDQFQNAPYMVMEYVDGNDLQKRVAGTGPLAADRAADYARQAAAGLQHAHEAGLIHRDIKPGNVLVDRNGVVKLLDLGLARFLLDPSRNDGVTERYDPNTVLGTADYMAPEQALGGPVDIRADIYSLGCTLYFLLTGRMVFEDGTVTQKLLWHQVKEPAGVRAKAPDVPEGLAAVIAKMMAKAPADRYQTPADVIAALAPFAAPAAPPPAAARPPVRPDFFLLGLSKPESGATVPTPSPSPATRPYTPAPADGPVFPGVPRAAPGDAGDRVTTEAADDPITMPISGPVKVPVRRRPVLAWAAAGGAAGLLAVAAVWVLVGFLFPGPKPATPVVEAGPAAVAPPPAAGPPAAPFGGLVLNGSGSSFVDKMMQHWAGKYEAAAGVKILYTPTGSSAGAKAILDRKVAFAASDAALSPEQMDKAAAAGGTVLHVPLVLGAVVPTYNLPDVPGQLRFTGPLLADIFLGKVTNWNDKAIRENNPGVPVPDKPIRVIHRADGSGTTAIWTDYLSQVSVQWRTRVGTGNTVKWPVGVGAEKNNGVADAVSRTDGGLGYVELSFALANNLPVGLVRNRSGAFVPPDLKSVTAAAAAVLTDIPADLRYTLTDVPGADAYPLAGTCWALVWVDDQKGADADVLDFLKWATHAGQAYAADLQYAPLPPALVAKIDDALAKAGPK